MYLVIGANGFLGSYIIKNIISETNEKIIATARDVKGFNDSINPFNYDTKNRVKWFEFELQDDNDIDKLAKELSNFDEKIKIVYLAAYHHPDKVEENFKLAWDINVISLAKILNKLDNVYCLFYASTDSVYGSGELDYKFKEEDRLYPENKYGQQKIAAECLINSYRYNVVRFPFLIGKSLLKKKEHFYDFIVNEISNGKTFDMFDDSYRSSLDFNTAGNLLIQLMERYDTNMPKIINIAADKALSKYDVGIMIANHEKIDSKYILPISIKNSNGIFTAKRACSTLIDNTKLKQYLGLSEIVLDFND